jgi:hypothetical protein
VAATTASVTQTCTRKTGILHQLETG